MSNDAFTRGDNQNATRPTRMAIDPDDRRFTAMEKRQFADFDAKQAKLAADVQGNTQPDRDRHEISEDLWSRAIGLDNQRLFIDMISEYVLHTGPRHDREHATQTTFAALKALAALNRETAAEIWKIGDELSSGEYNARED